VLQGRADQAVGLGVRAVYQHVQERSRRGGGLLRAVHTKLQGIHTHTDVKVWLNMETQKMAVAIDMKRCTCQSFYWLIGSKI